MRTIVFQRTNVFKYPKPHYLLNYFNFIKSLWRDTNKQITVRTLGKRTSERKKVNEKEKVTALGMNMLIEK